MLKQKLVALVSRPSVKVSAAVVALTSSQFAHAALTDLYADVAFTDVITAIFAIGILVIGVDLAMIGYMKVRRLVKGA